MGNVSVFHVLLCCWENVHSNVSGVNGECKMVKFQYYCLILMSLVFYTVSPMVFFLFWFTLFHFPFCLKIWLNLQRYVQKYNFFWTTWNALINQSWSNVCFQCLYVKASIMIVQQVWVLFFITPSKSNIQMSDFGATRWSDLSLCLLTALCD